MESGIPEIFIKSIFLTLGLGVLLPWNAFISAIQYFESRFCRNGRIIIPNVEQWFGVLYNLSSVLSLGIIIAVQWINDYEKKDEPLQHNFISDSVRSFFDSMRENSSSTLHQHPSSTASRQSERVPIGNSAGHAHTWWLVLFPLFLYFSVFAVMTVLVLFTGVSGFLFLIISLSGLAICGICQSLASAGIVGTAGLFDPNTGVAPYFNGQAVAGVLVAIMNFVVVLIEKDAASLFNAKHCSQENKEAETWVADRLCASYSEISWPTFTYFLSGTAVLSFCILGYKYIETYQEERAEQRMLYDALVNNDDISVDDETDASNKGPEFELYKKAENETLDVLYKVKGPALSLFNTFFITLVIFPGATSDLRSARQCQLSNRIMNDLYTPWTFVIFNIGDLVGRYLAGHMPTSSITSNRLVQFSFFRFLFLPIMAICPAQHDLIVEPILSDSFSLMIQLVFAVSNGMLTSLTFMHAPALVPATPHAQAKSSEILNFALSLGLLCGSAFAFPYIETIRQ